MKNLLSGDNKHPGPMPKQISLRPVWANKVARYLCSYLNGTFALEGQGVSEEVKLETFNKIVKKLLSSEYAAEIQKELKPEKEIKS